MERDLRWHTLEDTQEFGRALGGLLRGGDLVVLTGDLGAGKTTLTQAIAQGLGVRGPITSPTFVISRVHPSLVDGPELVHVDAYRLGSAVELDDLDLDADLDASVVIVEWGAGLAEQLSDTRLELTISGDVERTVHAVAVGPRFEHVLAGLLPWVA